MSDHARFLGPVPAQFRVIIDAPVSNIRVTTTNVLVPKGYQIEYSIDTRPMLFTFVRHNFDGSQPVFDANARKFGYFEQQRGLNTPTTQEYAFYHGWYRFTAGGSCFNLPKPGPQTTIQNVYLTLYNISCECGVVGNFERFERELLDVYRKNPGQVLTLPNFLKRFGEITTCTAYKTP